MNQPWALAVLGVRGSLPSARRECMEYGGDTSCFAVDCGRSLAVFDAGSGLQKLPMYVPEHTRIDLFLSHVHIDHVLGLFAFPPLHDPGMELHIYGEARGGVSFRTQLETLIGPPYWPLGLGDFKARLVLHEIVPGDEITLPGGEVVRTLRGNHPNGSILYRLENGAHSVAYTLDCECTDSVRPALTDFCRGAQVIIWDASFDNEGLARCPGWGHSSWEQGIEMRRAAGAGTVLMAHYSQNYSDTFLREQESLAHREDPRAVFAKEGLVMTL